jgi:transposase
VIVDALGNPAALSLTPGQASDLSQAEPLLDEVEPEAFLADKAYDADALIETLEERNITPVIPPKANRLVKRETDFALYRERNLVERFFCKIKQFRAIAVSGAKERAFCVKLTRGVGRRFPNRGICDSVSACHGLRTI